MGKYIFSFISLILFAFSHNAQAKVYDCFIFFNEIDILEIRLNELYDHVDKFVLVESLETFRGNLKPLYYLENQKRFAKFQDKIIHVIVEDRIQSNNPWVIEEFQRNQIMRGLKDCELDDVIFISDVDEIIRASSLPQIYSDLLVEGRDRLRCEQTLYRYFYNSRDYRHPWAGTCAITYEKLLGTTPNILRNQRENYHMVSNAGWHFTSMGGLNSFIQKLESFSHSELDQNENKTMNFVYDYMRTYGTFVPIDETYPKFFLDNFSYYLEKGFIFLPQVTVETNVRDIL